MDTAGYVTLSRQTGLADELQAVANNIANLSTTGYRREGLVFAEMVSALEAEGGSVALTAAYARVTSPEQGVLRATGGTFDLAIEGDGHFLVETPQGERLTRAGAFSPDAGGELVNPMGHRLLDAGGAPIFVPPDARSVTIATDGTLSADGQPITQIGLVTVDNAWQLQREDGVVFRTDAPLVPVEDGTILQGFIESANVNAVAEISRMIQVQRAYEAGQRLMDREDERIRQVISTMAAPA
ncbi:MAG: flagellar hook-basal body complex protein [Pseudomonadota bacterium]